MSITTNLTGRVRNTKLAYNRGLMPVFEAVQNSIHAIEDEDANAANGRIVVEIVRHVQPTLHIDATSNRPGPPSLPEIAGFRIRDNGIGFTDKHMTSFETLDTDLKLDIGGRGVGRLLWLKAFGRASLDSIYVDANGLKAHREFSFTIPDGVTARSLGEVEPDLDTGAVVFLEGFHPKYRDASRKTTQSIANSLFEHCLWYFVRPRGAPNILIVDGEESVNLDDVYQSHMHSSASTESFSIKGTFFDLTHVKLRSTISKTHFIGWCASNRLVDEENLAGKIPGLYGLLGDEDDEFLYACYVTSSYLDDRVLPERTGFVMPEKVTHDLFSDSDVSKEEIADEVIGRAADYLEPHLQTSREAGLSRVREFVAQEKPQYRPILSRIPEDELYVDPKISDKELDIVLHQHKSESERRLLSEGHEIMVPRKGEAIQDYEDRIAEYLQLADDIKKSDLAEYVSHRKVILDLLRIAIKQSENGSYAHEELIHSLIMPMRKDSDSIEFERNNLWLINERLTFHDFLASDRELRSMPITENIERKRPDLLALNVYDESILLAERDELPLASIVVVELKRPMRNDAASGEDHDPIEQSLGYLRRIRAGEVKTASGRLVPNSPDIPGFCYVVCDLTPRMVERCELQGLHITSDRMGYFGYNAPLRAYIEVSSFDQLLRSARERNRVFFDRLGLPTN